MIYLTGDTHCPIDIKKLNTRQFPEQCDMCRDDYLIILGDFGLYWHDDDEYRHWLKWFKNKKFTLLWLDGNHENHDWIAQMPVSMWHGGLVHQTEENIIHLMRGEIYTIEDKKIFVCGGAKSHDLEYRIEGKSYWQAENISSEECGRAIDNLKRHNWQVDHILTHTIYPPAVYDMFTNLGLEYKSDRIGSTETFLSEISSMVKYKSWYFGHYHHDKDYGKLHCLYRRIIKL